ncbi:dihydrodipicolinate synthase family protein [Algoriphagus sp. AK58]|uniref:dihydrodipicolinate synthase family protein n=1 Tax=Algoriphagus sp. AK58 TaxID=1406877 RepID=UPI00164FC05C|nr:dihydrodipicolinate synthase family protein [Algoriphagus sp. AK58]MBC6366900.1 dihydrodipicolinate synthase family protein [Algoriphagus sp. AK58]
MKTPASFYGIIPPMITPLNPDYSLDVDHTIVMVNHLLEGGVHGIFILGTTGESASLSSDVKSDLIRQVCRQVNGKVPVLVGITDCSFVESLDLAAIAADSGASALVAAPPFYMNIGQEELIAYYRKLADSVSLPLFLYNMPSHTKIFIDIATVKTLSSHPNIIGIKDSSGDLENFESLCFAFRDHQDFRIFVGPEEILTQTLEMGGHGGVTGGANLFPELYVQAYAAFLSGEKNRLRELQNTILFLSKNLYENHTYKSCYLKGLKAAMAFEGLCKGILAPPLFAYSEEEKKVLHEKYLRVKEKVSSTVTP